MNLKRPLTQAVAAIAIAGVAGFGALGFSPAVPALSAVHQAEAADSVQRAPDHEASGQALKTLNSFYKPALKGQFPGAASGLTVGQSTRQDVIGKIGKPPAPRKHADDFDVYGANMGNPGYAFSYKLNKIREIRYFGTNVERQTNIGGITMKMLKQNWYAPSSESTFRNGNATQTKLTYNRGEFKLEFIFNSSTDLDHINLLKR